MSKPDSPEGAPPSFQMTRRDLLKLGAISGASLALPLILNHAADLPKQAPILDRYSADILVIGSGFAGTFAALEARRRGRSVVMVDKGTVGCSGMSPWASDSRPFDPEIYSRDEWLHNLALNTEWTFDRRWMDQFLDESLGIFHTLHEWGVHEVRPFERSTIFRDRLDKAGVQIVERVMVTRLLQDDNGRVGGAVGFTYDDSSGPSRAVAFYANAVILCTGAGSYKSPGFPIWGLTFDGDAIAYAAGAGITGKEYHDTHMTVSNYPAASYDQWDWAQRVKGAYIMVGPPPALGGGLTIQAALAAASGQIRRIAGGGPGGELQSAGLDPEVERNRRYFGRGFLGDAKLTGGMTLDPGEPPKEPPGKDLGWRVGGATAGMGVHKGEGVFCSDYTGHADGVEGLYAAGDALGSAMCGANYPSRGFSSYGSAIQGRQVAGFASEYVASMPPVSLAKLAVEKQSDAIWAPMHNPEGFSPAWVTQTLRNTMTPLHILYVKEPRRLEGALASIEFLRAHCVPKLIARDGHELRAAHETAHMLLNAEMKLRAGLFRTESRGTHFREDFPARNDKEWFCRVVLRRNGDRMELSKVAMPDAWRPPASMSYRERYPRVLPGEETFLANHPDWV